MHLQYTALLGLLSLILFCGASPSHRAPASSVSPPPLTGGLVGIARSPDSTESSEDPPLTGGIYKSHFRGSTEAPPPLTGVIYRASRSPDSTESSEDPPLTGGIYSRPHFTLDPNDDPLLGAGTII